MISRNSIKFVWDMRDMLNNIMRMMKNLDTISPLVLDEWGEMLTDAIRSYTPYVTGERQASIGKFDVSLIGSNAAPGAAIRARQNAIYKVYRIKFDTWELVVGSNSEIVVWLNYGTSRMIAHHMFERGQAVVAQYLKPLVQEALEASVGPGNMNVSKWGTIRARQTFNPHIGGGQILRRLRVSRA